MLFWLECKFGGEWRKIVVDFEDLENIKFVCFENVGVIEKFVDLLDVIVVKFEEIGYYKEFG